VWCWAIIVNEAFQLIKAPCMVARIERELEANRISPPIAIQWRHPIAAVLEAGSREWCEGVSVDGQQETRAGRIERAIRTALGGELRRVQKRLPFLATVGSVAPFIGCSARYGAS
jgi:biopolymer transport protein TolQ